MTDPESIVHSVRDLSDDELHNLAEVVRQVQIERAVALLPLVDGTALDVVSGRARGGQHSVEHVISYEVRSGDLVEVSQRTVTASHGR